MSGITPADARRTIDILQDDAKRAELITTLKTIAAAEPSGSAAGSSPTPASGAQSTSGSAAPTSASTIAGASSPASVSRTSAGAVAPASPAAAQAPAVNDAAGIVPLESDGLMARTLRSLNRWMDNFAAQMAEAGQAAKDIPALLANSRAVTTSAGQHMLALLAMALAGAFAAGLLLEWGLHRALRRPRIALKEHANQSASRHAALCAGERPSAAIEETTPSKESAPGATIPASVTSASSAASAASVVSSEPGAFESTASDRDAAQAGLRPPAEGVAVIQTHRDGVDRVETVLVGTDNAAGSPDVPKQRQESASAQEPVTHDGSWRHNPRHHWRTMRNLPYAIAALVLDILPIALFFIAASVALRFLAGDHPRIGAAITGFIEAYVALRLTMAVVRLLAAPAGQGLRLLDVSPAVAHVLVTWMRWIVGLALFGMAIANTIPLLGTAAALRMAFLKAVSLLVHLGAVVLILKLRRPMRLALRAAPDAGGPLAVARNWLADAWAAVAIVFVMGVWVVWAMGVQDGFPKLVHFVLISAVVLIVARLLAILILGSLGRLFSAARADSTDADAGANEPRSAARLSERYYPWTRGLVSVVLILCTIVVLFESWGVDALGWFAGGTLGRSLASAALTIVIACIVAIVIWEAAQYAVERRLARWTRQGDAVRAARLRTLLPMLRTALFVVVALVVGLTALNEIGINTTPLLAGASIIGVAVGFGSQKLVQDFITGIFLLMENAMRVGDWVTVAGVSGSVEYLSIRTVRLRGGDGALYIVPFSSVSTVSNTNRGIGNAAVRISVAYDTDIDVVVRELKEIGASLRGDDNFKDQILNDIEVWGVDSVDGSMVTLVGQMRCSDKGRWGVQREINRRILDRFRELGIAIANPRASLLLAADASPLAATPAADGPPDQGNPRQGDGAGQSQRRT